MATTLTFNASSLPLAGSLPFSQGSVDSSLEFVKTNLYTIILPSFLTFAFLLHWQLTSPKDDTRYEYVGYRSWFEPTWLLRLRYVFSGFDIVQKGYDKYHIAKEAPFWVRRNDADVLVLPTKFLKEISHFTRQQLSGIEALAFNVLGKFNGIDLWTRSDLHIRVLRTHVVGAMGTVMGNARDELNHAFPKYVPECKEWEEVDIVNVFRWLIGAMSAKILLGSPACRDDKYIKMTLDYSNDIFFTTFFTHRFPEWMAPIVLWCLPQRWRLITHQNYAIKTMKPMIKQYEDAMAIGAEDAEPPTLLNGMLKESHGSEKLHLSTEDIVGSQMITSLASIHTTMLTITYCIMEICRHPEIIPELEEEAREGFVDTDLFGGNYTSRLPKLDSLIHEINRVHPPSILLPQRKAKVSFTLSDGTEISEGTQFAFPLGPAQMDPKVYNNPDNFDAFRSYRARMASGGLNKGRHLASAPAEDYLVFGHGSQACPGRHLAINKIKLLLMYLLIHYDFKEPERQKGKRLCFPFEEYNMMNPSLKLMMKRKRETGQ